MKLLFVSIFLLITAVATGLYLVFLGLRKHKRSLGLGLTHASLALAGIIVLFTQIVTGPTDKLNNVAATAVPLNISIIAFTTRNIVILFPSTANGLGFQESMTVLFC